MNNCVDCCHHKRQPGGAYWSWAETQSPCRCFGFWEFLSSSYLISFLSSSSPLTFVIFMYPHSYPASPPTSFHLPVLLVLRFLIPSMFYSPFIFYYSSFNSPFFILLCIFFLQSLSLSFYIYFFSAICFSIYSFHPPYSSISPIFPFHPLLMSFNLAYLFPFTFASRTHCPLFHLLVHLLPLFVSLRFYLRLSFPHLSVLFLLLRRINYITTFFGVLVFISILYSPSCF